MMKKAKKLMSAVMLLFVLIVSAMLPTEVSAAIEDVYDDAGLLSEDDEDWLGKMIDDLKEKTGWDIFVVTTADAGGKTAAEYADDFYDARTEEDSDGVLLLIDMDNRELYVSTCGEAIRYLIDDRIEALLDDAYPYVSEGKYDDCFSDMLISLDIYYDEGIYEDQYNYDVETGEISYYKTITLMEAVIAILLAAAAGAIMYFSVKGSYKIGGAENEYDYRQYGAVNLTDTEDRFVHQNVTKQVIKRDNGGNNGGGGGHVSSVHTSSSGRSHGGGGRSF